MLGSYRLLIVATVLAAGSFIGAATVHAQQGSGYVGVTLFDLSAEQAATVGLRGPVVVAGAVGEGGPAFASGLRQYDAINSIDGRRVGGAADASAMLGAKKVGEKVLIGLTHPQGNGRSLSIEISVTVARRPTGYGENTGGPSGMQQMPNTDQAPNAQPMPGAQPPRGAPPARGQMPGRQGTRGMHYVDMRTVVQGTPQQRGHCSAMVPPGWSMRASPIGKNADLDGPDGSHASWGIDGVNTQGGSYYGAIMGPPEDRALLLAGAVSRGKAQFVGQPFMVAGYFIAHQFATENSQGTVLYHVWPGPSASEYIQSVFVSSAPKGSVDLARQAEAVMISITCNTQTRPVPNTPPPGGPRSTPGGSRGPAGNDEDAMQDYNAQLGSQWATSPTTGEKYLLDYATQWSASGPEGPGYYINGGTGPVRLRTGWRD